MDYVAPGARGNVVVIDGKKQCVEEFIDEVPVLDMEVRDAVRYIHKQVEGVQFKQADEMSKLFQTCRPR